MSATNENDQNQTHQPDDFQSQVDDVIGLGNFSARKSYYPELQLKIEELREEKNKFERIFTEATSGIFQASLNGQILVANPALVEMCAYPDGASFCRIDLATQLFASQSVYTMLLSRLETLPSIVGFETQFKTFNGELIDVSLNISLRTSGKQTYLESFVQNITARKMAEEKQQKIKKLESLGVFAGGVAHDFNNLLSGLFGSIEMAKMYLSPDHRAYSLLTAALKALDNASSLTTQLMTFAKGGNPVKEIIQLEEVVRESADFAARSDRVKLVYDVAEKLMPISADKGQMSQVITNLIVNAQQAMPAGGTIYISIANCSDRQPCNVQLRVQDQGVGIEPNALEHIFEPYFTTKKHGNGLGLASTHSIVTGHGGTIQVESELGQGTTFIINLPALEEDACRRLEDVTTQAESSKIQGRAMVMDNDEIVCFLVSEMLKEIGLDSEQISDGHDLLAKYQQAFDNNSAPDIIVLDLSAPEGLGGWQASQEILKINPLAKIIVTSGSQDDPMLQQYSQYGFAAALAKPFNFNDLENTVARIFHQ